MMEPDVRALLTRLSDDAWQVRKQAVTEVVDCILAGPGGLGPLGEHLLDALEQGDNVGLRGAAVDVLGHLKSRATSALLSAYERVAPEARKFVLHALGEGGDAASLPTLLGALESGDVNCRAAAVEALAQIGGSQAAGALVARLALAESFEVMAALDGLTRMQAQVPFPALEPLLADGLLRRGAMPLLGRCADERAVGPLTSALDAASASLRGAAARGLVELREVNTRCEEMVAGRMLGLNSQGREGLLSLLDSADPATSTAAAQLSLFAREPDALPAVVRLTEEGALSAEALAPLQDWGDACVSLLLAYGEAQAGRAGGIALELAAEICTEAGPVDDVREALRQALASTDGARVEAAARGLARWAEAEDAPRVVAAAKAFDDVVARACATSLARLAASDPRAVSDALSDAVLEGGFGAAMAKVAGVLPPSEAQALLATGLRAQDARARKAAVETLGRLEDHNSRNSEISFALTDEDRAVQAAAARSMGATLASGSADERAELGAALASPDASVRAAAAAGVAQDAGDVVTAQLMKLVDDANANVAVEALLALGRIRATGLARLARAALTHAEAERRKAGLRSLALAASPELLELAAAHLKDPAWDVRVTAAQVLAGLEATSARATLRTHLASEEDATVRATIAALLESTDDRGGAIR